MNESNWKIFFDSVITVFMGASIFMGRLPLATVFGILLVLSDLRVIKKMLNDREKEK